MWWNEPLPESIKAAAERAGVPVPEGSYHLTADLDEDGQFARRWLVLTREHLLVLTPDGQVKQKLAVAQIDNLEACNHVGGGLLRAEVSSQKIPLVRYSAARGLALGIIARGFKDFKEKGRIDVSEKDRPKRCPHCNRPLDLDESVCPHCISKGRILLRLWEYARAFRGRIVLIAILMAIGVAGNVVPITLWKYFVDDVLGPNAQHPEWLLGIVVLYASIIALEAGIRALLETQSIYVGMNLVYRVRRDLFNHVMRMGLPFFDKYRAGELMSRIDNDSGRLETLIVDALTFLVRSALMFVAVLAALLWLNWRLALLAMIPLPLVVAFAFGLFPWVSAAWHRLQQRQANLSATINSVISGVRLVKAFGREDSEIGRFDRRSTDLRDTGIQLARTFALVFPVLGLAMHSGSMVLWYFGGKEVISKVMTLGELMAFAGLLGMFYGPFESMLFATRWVSRTMAAAQRVFDILDVEADPAAQEARERKPQIEGRIRFDKVTFGYEPLKPVLKAVDLEIAPGEMIGLVGESGVGKTTATNLILRFYTVNEGMLLIDGVDIKAIATEDLRTQMAAVPQEPFLFPGSAGENVGYGRPDATPQDTLQTAMIANAHDFIMRMPDAYDSAVGEQGGRLSVGEKQRLTIARALIRNPRILILDEATSSVDTDTEKQIQQALERLVKGRTTIAIAHRLSTLRHATRLVVLKEGRVHEVGSHEELLQKGGEYKRLVELQSEMSRVQAVGG